MPKRPREDLESETQEQRLRRARNQRYQAKRKEAKPPSQPRATPAQLQQGEKIIELGFTEQEQDAAATLAQMSVGLRVQGFTLAQDAEDVRIRQGAMAIDEHHTLYNNEDLIVATKKRPLPNPPMGTTHVNRPSQPRRSQSNYTPLTQFFPLRSHINPFSISTSGIVPPS